MMSRGHNFKRLPIQKCMTRRGDNSKQNEKSIQHDLLIREHWLNELMPWKADNAEHHWVNFDDAKRDNPKYLTKQKLMTLWRDNSKQKISTTLTFY